MRQAARMPYDEQPAHTTVEVGFDNSDYVNVCDNYGGGFELLDQWRALGDLLAHRPGWHFDVVTRGEALWSLGSFGESLLNIHVQADGSYHCLDYLQDKRSSAGDTDGWLVTRSLGEIEEWLAKREEQSRKPSPLTMQILSDEDWRVLRLHLFPVRVSWSDGWYLATVRGLPEEATFEKTLKAVIDSTKAMIVRSLDAPTEVAADLRLRVCLDEGAASQFAQDGN